MKKTKEKIRYQIILSLEAYRGKKGILFYDSDNVNFDSSFLNLDDNDIEVLLMELKRSRKILVTTKCLYYIEKQAYVRVNGNEIEGYGFLNQLDELKFRRAKRFKTPAGLKSWLYSGDFRIIKKEGTDLTINIPHHDLGFCIVNAIKKLQFVTKKYTGI